MLLGKPFAQFVEESPISVMMRCIVEYAFDAKRLDEIFEETADAQYTRELRFSTVADYSVIQQHTREGFYDKSATAPKKTSQKKNAKERN
jgi:hypothetical protein